MKKPKNVRRIKTKQGIRFLAYFVRSHEVFHGPERKRFEDALRDADLMRNEIPPPLERYSCKSDTAVEKAIRQHRRLVEQGCGNPTAQIAAEYEVSRRTVRRWLNGQRKCKSKRRLKAAPHHEQIRKELLSGTSILEIGRLVGVSHCTVRGYAARHLKEEYEKHGEAVRKKRELRRQIAIATPEHKKNKRQRHITNLYAIGLL